MQKTVPLSKWISALSRYHQLHMARALEPIGIGYGQYSLLLSLLHNPGIRQDQLAEMMFLNKSTIARSVAQLEESGYLERQVDARDKRAFNLYPTEKARSVRETILQAGDGINRTMTQGLSSEEISTLDNLLERMYRNVFPTRQCEEKRDRS